jgi:hypothetical protein
MDQIGKKVRTFGTMVLAWIVVAGLLSPVSAAPSVSGRWASTVGGLVVTFKDGKFTTKHVRSGKVLARGNYRASMQTVTMQWRSIEIHKPLKATCTLVSNDGLVCKQRGMANLKFRRIR